MKTKILIAIVLICFIANIALAQGVELPKAGTIPGSLFYFLERIWESIVTFFTFGDFKKAERYANLAAERLAEAQAIAGKEKPELTEKTLTRYEKQLEKSIARVEKAESKDKNAEKIVEAATRVAQATSKHLEVLAEVYEKVPEQAKPAIENAMKSSLKGHTKAVEILKAKNALGDVPEEVSLPAEISEEVRERIQTRAQQELQIEEFLKEPESMESIRGRCTEQGGPTEICEKIPLKGFKSFKALEDFCLEVGAPPEACAATEDMCKEFGVTTADECFRIMTTATAEAGTAVISTPQSVESFEEIEANCLRGGEAPEICASIEAECKEAGVMTPGECVQYWFSTRSSLQAPLLEGELEERRIEEETIRRKEEGETIKLQNPYLGVSYSTINNEMQAERGLSVNSGALVIGIAPDSPAASAGLKEGDIIIEFNGERITEDNNLTEMLYRSRASAVVSLIVLRGEQVFEISVVLVERPAN